MPNVDQPCRTVGILVFEAMEVLDYSGPYEVFNVANETSSKTTFDVHAIGVAAGPVTGRGGFTVLPPTNIAECSVPDVLIVPGGAGTRPFLREPKVVDWVRSAAADAELVLSVCTGALVLAAAGLLENSPATTHHQAFDELAAISPSTDIVRDRRFVQSSSQVWTSGGISAGIDLSLHLVGLLAGTDIRTAVIAEMEWGW
jgi:transcriptional regulator GlxA family with amidase domain